MRHVAPTSLDDLEEGVASGSFPLHLDRENTKEEHLNRGARSVPGDRWDEGGQVVMVMVEESCKVQLYYNIVPMSVTGGVDRKD